MNGHLARPGRRQLLKATAAAALALPRLGHASAAGGNVRITLAYPPGGVSDTVLRELATLLAPRLDAVVTVDHQPGAGGALALRALSRARPDGRSLCFCAITPLTVQPHLGPAQADLTQRVEPVVAVMDTPVLLLGTPALPGADFAAVLARARDAATSVRWASSGVATTGHLVLEHVRRNSGGHFVHVPYSGGGAQITAALAGEFEVLSSNVAALQLELVRQGRLKALAVGARAPLPQLPDVPTLAMLGHEAANLGSVFGLFAPLGTPAAAMDRVQAAVADALAEPALRRRLVEAGSVPRGEPRALFALAIRAESQRHAPLIRAKRERFG